MSAQSGVEHWDVVVVGAGQAGLAVSWYLQLLGVDLLVIVKGRVGESWRSARWDSFTLVTPAWMTRLPGLRQGRGEGERFTARDDFVTLVDAYAESLPVRDGVEVLSASRRGDAYWLTTSMGPITARAVVAASGAQRLPKIPSMAARMPDTVLQLHAGQYRNPESIPAGGVLVVGSGQSGGQITEELAGAGRQVFLATSRVGRVPRRYRGRDAHDWVQEMGLDDQPVEQARPEDLRTPHPLLSGAHGGQTIALQQLARDGVTLKGRLVGLSGNTLSFADDLAENMSFADRAAAGFRRSVDEHIVRHGLVAPPPDDDPAERPNHHHVQGGPHVDINSASFRTVIWCTGFGPDTGWIDLPVLDQRGHIVSAAGVTSIPGFFTLGAPWLSHRGSGLLYGVGTDASRIARHVVAFLGLEPPARRSPARAPLEVSFAS
jgi:putative flavoprotein involved in K+ transport